MNPDQLPPMRYKLRCISWNDRHVKFNVFDPTGANCGQLCVLTQDVFNFVQNSWRGDIYWDGHLTDAAVACPEDYGARQLPTESC